MAWHCREDNVKIYLFPQKSVIFIPKGTNKINFSTFGLIHLALQQYQNNFSRTDRRGEINFGNFFCGITFGP